MCVCVCVCVVDVQWRRVCGVFSEHGDDVTVRPIHLFVLSNVLRRPLIVVGVQSHCSGVYVPAVHSATYCCRSPLVLVHVRHQFSSLVPRAADAAAAAAADSSLAESGVPLWRADTDQPLVARCLLATESPQLVLDTYLHVVQLSHTSHTAVRLFPVAKYDVIAPPDVDILDELVAPAASLPVRLTQTGVISTRSPSLAQSGRASVCCPSVCLSHPFLLTDGVLLHCKKVSVYPRTFVASFPYFNGNGSVRLYPYMDEIMKTGAHIAMWACTSLFRPFMDTNVYGTGFLKIWKAIRGYADIFTVCTQCCMVLIFFSMPIFKLSH